jgi:hypothetical protein
VEFSVTALTLFRRPAASTWLITGVDPRRCADIDMGHMADKIAVVAQLDSAVPRGQFLAGIDSEPRKGEQ